MMELKEQTMFMVIAIIPSLIINIIGNTYFLPTWGGIATAYSAFFSALIYFIITSIFSIFIDGFCSGFAECSKFLSKFLHNCFISLMVLEQGLPEDLNIIQIT